MGEIVNLHVPQRLEGETFEAYQQRRLSSRVRNKMNAKGYMLWNSKELGQYVKNKNLTNELMPLIDDAFVEMTQ